MIEFPPDSPATFQELLWYIRQYERDIYVRDQDEAGRWDAIAVADLTPRRWAFHVDRWLSDGTIPVMIIRHPEPPTDQAADRAREVRQFGENHSPGPGTPADLNDHGYSEKARW